MAARSAHTGSENLRLSYTVVGSVIAGCLLPSFWTSILLTSLICRLWCLHVAKNGLATTRESFPGCYTRSRTSLKIESADRPTRDSIKSIPADIISFFFFFFFLFIIIIVVCCCFFFWHHSPWKPFASSLAASQQNMFVWDGVVAPRPTSYVKNQCILFFIWAIAFGLSGRVDPSSSHTKASIAVRIIWTTQDPLLPRSWDIKKDGGFQQTETLDTLQNPGRGQQRSKTRVCIFCYGIGPENFEYSLAC